MRFQVYEIRMHMDYKTTPRRVPHDAGTSITPPSKSQLQMAYHDLTPSREDTKFILLMDKDTGRYRPAVVTFPEGDCYALVYTAEDYARKQQCKTQRQWEALEPHTMAWDASQEVRDLVWYAQNGLYKEQAEAAGYDSAISYVLNEVEEREGGFRHYVNKNPHVGEGLG